MVEYTKTRPKDTETQPMPLVFMFPPDRYKIVPNERLAEWEELLQERVGMKLARSGGMPTVSFCGGGTDIADACDSDYLAT